MCYIQVKNIRLNSFYEEKKIKLCLTKQLLNMFKLWCEWGISKGDLDRGRKFGTLTTDHLIQGDCLKRNR